MELLTDAMRFAIAAHGGVLRKGDGVPAILHAMEGRKRKQAVEALSSVLWGFTSQECRDILERFFPKDE